MAKYCLEKIVSRDTKVLVLGSLPGDASLAAQQYYAHKQNHFWTIMSELTTLPLVSLPYSKRIHALVNTGIGLWDIAASAVRLGSADMAIGHIKLNDLEQVIRALPALRAVAFNGATAAKAGFGFVQCFAHIAVLNLPSTSSANRMSNDLRLKRWSVIRDFL